jgi:hypothetical protein
MVFAQDIPEGLSSGPMYKVALLPVAGVSLFSSIHG